MTTTTPHDVANGSAMARKPKMMSRIAHTIEPPDPSLETTAPAMISFSLRLEIRALKSIPELLCYASIIRTAPLMRHSSEEKIQRQSPDIQVLGLAGCTVLTQIIGLDHKQTLIRPFHTGGVLFFVPGARCAAIESFCRCVRAELELADRDVILTKQQISVSRRVDAVDPAKLDPVSVRNQKPRSWPEPGNGCKYQTIFIARASRLGALHPLVSAAKQEIMFLIRINVHGMRFGNGFPLITDPESCIHLLIAEFVSLLQPNERQGPPVVRKLDMSIHCGPEFAHGF